MYCAGMANWSRLSRSSRSGFMKSYHEREVALGICSIKSMTPTSAGIGMARGSHESSNNARRTRYEPRRARTRSGGRGVAEAAVHVLHPNAEERLLRQTERTQLVRDRVVTERELGTAQA